jgi:hypothetical protein
MLSKTTSPRTGVTRAWRAFCIRRSAGCIEDVENAFAGGPGGLEHLVEAMQPADGFVEQGEIEEETDQLAQREDAIKDLGPPRHSTRTVPRAAAKLMAGEIIGPGEHDAERALAQIVGALGESRVLVFFVTKGFDLADALEIVHEQGVHGAGGAALGAVTAMGGEVYQRAPPASKGIGHHGDRGESGLRGEQDGEDADDAEHGNGPLFGAVDEDAFDGVDVLDDARHEVARGALIEITDREPLEMGVDIAAEIEDDILLEDVVDADAEAGEEIAEKERDQKSRCGPGAADAGFCWPMTSSMMIWVSFGKANANSQRKDAQADVASASQR